MTMHGEHVVRVGDNGILPGGVHGNFAVSRDIARSARGQNAVDINLAIFIVKQVEHEIASLLRFQQDSRRPSNRRPGESRDPLIHCSNS